MLQLEKRISGSRTCTIPQNISAKAKTYKRYTMKRNSVLPILAILFTGLLVYSLNVHTAKASGTVYIKGDGSVDPPAAPITTTDNVTYVLIGNINDSVVIERDNIIVDGAGYTIQGIGSDQGILLAGRSNVTIQHVVITTFDMGILLFGSSNSTVNDNKITNNNQGVKVANSSTSNISQNDIYANKGNGIDLYESPESSIHENSLTSNAWSGIKLEGTSCNDTEIVGNSVTTNGQNGIMLTGSSTNNSLVGNNVTANAGLGIWLDNSPSNTLSSNNVANNGDGIYFFSSTNNTLTGNTMQSNTYNFGVYGTDLPTFTHSVDTSNLVDGKPIYYLINQSNTGDKPRRLPRHRVSGARQLRQHNGSRSQPAKQRSRSSPRIHKRLENHRKQLREPRRRHLPLVLLQQHTLRQRRGDQQLRRRPRPFIQQQNLP